MDPAAYEQMAALEERHWWYRGRREVLRTVLDEHAPARPTRIVELGCGTGGNLDLLSESGQVTGVDASPRALELAARVPGATLLRGRLPDELPVPAASFDWVCLLDVLEHVEDDIAALSACRRLLTGRGAMIVTVPAYAWLWSRHDDLHHHRRRYTRDTLLAAADRAGLRAAFCSYFNTMLLPIAVAARAMDRLLKPARATGAALPPRWANEVLFALFAAERHLLRRMPLPFGLSIVAVLRSREAASATIEAAAAGDQAIGR